MQPKLELWYFADVRPWILDQAWGIYNPLYQKFGFDHHNGIDVPIASDALIFAPVKCKVNRIDYFPDGGGNQVELITTEKWNVGGVDCYILLVFMHNKQIIASVGDILEVGQQIAIPDNTGFSTGPHTHFGIYRLNDDMTWMDNNATTNGASGSSDPMPYFNGKYASDYTLAEQALKTAAAVNSSPALTVSQKLQIDGILLNFLRWLFHF